MEVNKGKKRLEKKMGSLGGIGGARSKEEKDGNKQSLQKLVGCEWMYGVREWT